MKITDIKATPVNMPLEVPFRWTGCHEPSQSLFRWQYLDVIEGGPFRQTHNVVRVPEGPSLGVTLDRKALQRMHEDFVDNGPMDHFQNPAVPGRFQRLPLN